MPFSCPLARAGFVKSVTRLGDLPRDAFAEVAFAGRSNSGKSSAINALANRKRLAFVSKTPGRTQEINLFAVDEGRYLVDLPGYGFARVPQEVKAHWEKLLSAYLAQRQPLAGVVVIMDIRHPLTPLDRRMLEWFAPSGRPVLVLLTKCDKLTRSATARTVREVQAALAQDFPAASAQAFSSVDRTGLESACRQVCAWLEIPTPQ